MVLNKKNILVRYVNISLLIVFILSLSFSSCSTDDPEIPDKTEEFEFELLQIEKDTIMKGETTHIEAIAKGTQLSYYWSASVGDILGSGNKVTYGASPCALGNVEIKCEVKDANNNSDEKSVKLFIKQ